MPAAIAAGVAYFAIVYAIGFVLGTIRTLLLMPRVGLLAAIVIELPLLLGASWLICRWLTQALALPATSGPRIAMGLVAFALLLAAEAALSMLLIGETFAQHLASYRGLPQLLGLAGQILFALFPLLQLRAVRAA